MSRTSSFIFLITLTIIALLLNEVTIIQYPVFASNGATISYGATSTVYLADSGKTTNYVYTMSTFVKSGYSTWKLEISTVTVNGTPVSVTLESKRRGLAHTTYYVFTAPEKVKTLQIDGYTFTKDYVEEHPAPTALFVLFMLFFFVLFALSKPINSDAS